MNLTNVQTFSSAVRHAIDKLDRGRVVFTGRGETFVQCKKHPDEWIDASDAKYQDERTILDYIVEAFDRCKGCLEEKQWAATRFPESAEL